MNPFRISGSIRGFFSPKCYFATHLYTVLSVVIPFKSLEDDLRERIYETARQESRDEPELLPGERGSRHPHTLTLHLLHKE